MYAKCGRNGDARKVFDEMPVRNVVSCSGMIYGQRGRRTVKVAEWSTAYCVPQIGVISDDIYLF
ncbi:hypothetical protein HanRHA438_Chr01g0046311 [Helianthus annuus]|uniref:Pentatricopeptide repeat protein n=1 Tax=Helianthus annuus TaxID=4232 RepID=A0A9K3JYL0_HELAN|nr:hypothetical protein HanXRQr2_Chr01g0045231 [Helianthus annuus]KAJ0613375.1 hypothetical protein HanHA300_Chr01g0037321 [Helianthus annuus]KAJ0625128.1 hypothetical protein HanIR_Chr01g0050421 [Helianthus annuus]KAJ0628739.1 hypothetical protein HanHA89_Chr01g0039701 [Helianthus annuus]KAJ0785064.1 hypothetical protein HanLR1_Chr01g0038601 [Helianthus annuus]